MEVFGWEKLWSFASTYIHVEKSLIWCEKNIPSCNFNWVYEFRCVMDVSHQTKNYTLRIWIKGAKGVTALTLAIEEVFCENLQVPEFWDFEISCWHLEVSWWNVYIFRNRVTFIPSSLIYEDSLNLECSLNSEEPMRIGYSISG